MAFPVTGTFDYWLGGRSLTTLAKATGTFDYWQGGRPIGIGASAPSVTTARPMVRTRRPANTDRMGRGGATALSDGLYLQFAQGAIGQLTAQSVLCLYYEQTNYNPALMTQLNFLQVGSGETVTDTILFRQSVLGDVTLRFGGGSSAAIQPGRKGTINLYGNDQWNHVGATWDGSNTSANINLYLGLNMAPLVTDNGIAVDGNQTPGDPVGDMSLCGPLNSETTQLNGSLGYVARWNRVLSLAEMRQAQQQGPGSVGEGLVFYWSCGIDRGRHHLAPNVRMRAGLNRGMPFPPTGGRVYTWSAPQLRRAVTANIKTINSLLVASAKTVNGLSYSSGVKTWNGLAK